MTIFYVFYLKYILAKLSILNSPGYSFYKKVIRQMDKINQKREAYHVSIRKEKATKPLEKIRQEMIDPKSRTKFMVKRIS